MTKLARLVGGLVLVVGAALVLTGPAWGQAREHRVALVIGNATYKDSPLNNPANDAKGMAQSLRAQGFQVIEKINANNVGMRRAVAEFGEKLQEGGVGLFYYSGHGMQVNGRNYLIPVDAEIRSEAYVSAEALDVDAVLGQLDGARSRVNIVILDACRNNPFARRFRSATRGLAFMQAPTGTFIAYATSPGDVADDGAPGSYGVFTGELIKALREPIRIEDVFKRVGLAVQQQTQKRQTPWVASNLTGDFSFVAAPSPQAPAPVVASIPAGTPRMQVREEARPALGSLILSAKLDGIEVLLDDQKLGETKSGRALVIDNVPAGTHRLRAKKSGHKDWEREIQVAANQRADVSIDLEQIKASVSRSIKLLFEEDFRSTQRWPVGRSPQCDKRYADTGYVIDNIAVGQNTSCTISGVRTTFPARVRIELATRLLSGEPPKGFGFRFGMPKPNNAGFLFRIDMAGRYGLLQHDGGKWAVLITPQKSPAILTNDGAVNKIAVEVEGQTIRCYVNDTLVGTAAAPVTTEGQVALYVNAAGTSVAFSHLRVLELP